MQGFIYNNILTINGGQKDIKIVKFYIFHLRSKWYRTYSDQWIEQGNSSSAQNLTIVSLITPFISSNYNVHACIITSASDYAWAGQLHIKVRTTTTIEFPANTSGRRIWVALGY